MANILSKQYSSVFSTPRVTLQDAKSFFGDTETENSLHNRVFAEDYIIAAIDERQTTQLQVQMVSQPSC